MAQWHTHIASSAVAAAVLAFAGPAAAEFDRAALKAQGEVLVVAVHDSFEAAAATCADRGDEACAAFFTARADAVANGAELYALPVPPGTRTDLQDVESLGAEYGETYALITSEAADRAPYQVARVQTAYEGWVNASYQGDDAATGRWHARWQQAIDSFGEGGAPAEEAPWRVSYAVDAR